MEQRPLLCFLHQSTKKAQAGFSKSWNASFSRYIQLSLFLWLKLYKLSPCFSKFEFNHVSKLSLQKIGGRHYKEIIDDLKERKMLIENPHYLHVASPESKSFTKSYVIHHAMRKRLEKHSLEVEEFEVRKAC